MDLTIGRVRKAGAVVVLALGSALATAVLVYLGVSDDSLLSMTKLAYLLVVLSIVVVYTRRDPLGSAVFVVAITPFDGLFYRYFGHPGNLITLLPIVIFLSGLTRERYQSVFLGTRIQRWMLFYILLLSVSYVPLLFELKLDAILVYGQKVGLFLLVGLLAHSFRDEESVFRISRIFVISTTVYVMLSIAEFYYGIQFFPEGVLWGDQGVLSALETQGLVEYRLHDYRLRGVGTSLSVNGLATFLLPPLFLAYGWWLTRSASHRLNWRPILFGLIIGLGLIGTLSRSGLLGLSIGVMTVALMLIFSFPNRVSSIVMMVAGGLVSAWFLVTEFGLVEVLEWRLSPEEIVTANTRVFRWHLGLEMFQSAPWTGVGAGRFSEIASAALFGESPEAHNAVISLLAEHGLIGTVPFLLIVIQVLLVLIRVPYGISRPMNLWRLVFAGAFAGLLTANMFNTYHYERSFWIVVAFAAALENMNKRRLEIEAIQ